MDKNKIEILNPSDITVIRFYICDKSKKGLRNQLEVLSDCKQIARYFNLF